MSTVFLIFLWYNKIRMSRKFNIKAEDFRIKYISVIVVLSVIAAAGVLFYWDKTEKEFLSIIDFPEIEILKEIKKEGIVAKTWISKQITQCAEEWQDWAQEKNKEGYKQPWEENKEYNIGLIEQGIKEFYQEKGIIIYDIEYEELEPEIHCLACDCLSDIKLHVLVSNKDITYFLELGFGE